MELAARILTRTMLTSKRRYAQRKSVKEMPYALSWFLSSSFVNILEMTVEALIIEIDEWPPVDTFH